MDEEQKSKENNSSIKMNNIIINSENTAGSNVMNSNSSFTIKKLKIKPKEIPRTKKDDIFTNESTA